MVTDGAATFTVVVQVAGPELPVPEMVTVFGPVAKLRTNLNVTL